MADSILIVEDNEINRMALVIRFNDTYNVIEAEDGEAALNVLKADRSVVAVLLDLQMPKIDGFGVLREMNALKLMDHIPVFVVTGESDQTVLREVYNLKATDVISKAQLMFVRRRVENTIELYRQRRKLQSKVDERDKHIAYMNTRILEVMSETVESRSQESGEHIKRVCGITEIILRALIRDYPEYALPEEDVSRIVFSAVLHDVGKICISDLILNKPKSLGRLTDEEFEIMKTHTTRGCEIIARLKDVMDEKTYQFSYDICRFHHERFDGRGYPDRLAGDDIPIWAQVVSVADVYDALSSPRVYKEAFPHEKSVSMILNSECGVFNPKILDVFKKEHEKIRDFHQSTL